MSLNTLLINQVAYGWNNVEATFSAGLPIRLPTISSIDYGRKITMKKAYGAGQEAYGRTDGIIEVDDAKITIGLPDWVNLLNAVGGEAGLRTEAGAFDLNMSYAASNIVVSTNEVLVDCRIMSHTTKVAQGSEEIKVEIGLSVMKLRVGNNLLSLVLGLNLP